MNPLTQQVKYELNRVLPSSGEKPSTRRAQVSSMLRFGGGFFSEGRRCWIDAELDTREAAVLLRDEIARLFNATPRAFALSTGTFKVRQIHRAHHLAVQVGLLSPSGRPVMGMAPTVVAGTRADAAAALRGALLARGQITTHELRRPRLEVVCPSAPAAMALMGFARRHGVQTQMREYVRDGAPVDVFEIRSPATSCHSSKLRSSAEPRPPTNALPTYERRRWRELLSRRDDIAPLGRLARRVPPYAYPFSFLRAVEDNSWGARSRVVVSRFGQLECPVRSRARPPRARLPR
ncbi:sporulation transcription regulator whiA [Mycobacteroides abscessus subsp. bolletii]|nr:sporulation transcription regulator whiA [Mycobacteroides abscessus]SKF42166.1 sporulation transcription regulator whiA [Mycobacteroides abscessus subsp. bolletii]SKH18117.1 sporulation transcription regulator whiA [Mycobacteroides abscessus subsp. bolletii]